MKPTPTIADVFAGAQYGLPAKTQRRRKVLLVGAASRLGERVLSRLLASSQYERIYVLTQDTLASTETKLCPMSISAWTHQIDDVIAVVSSTATGATTLPRKRTEIYSSLAPNAVLAFATQAKAHGVTRFMLITPTDILTQPAAIYAQLANVMEVELHHIGFESLVVVRPSDYEIRQRNAGFGARYWNILLNTMTGLMVGKRHIPLSLEQTASAVVQAMLESDSGLRIIEADRLRMLLDGQN